MGFRLLFSFLFVPLFACTQNANPPRGRVYNDSTIISLFITIDADSLAALYKVGNECNNHEYPVSMVWSDGLLPNDTLLNVGFRLKGNTSRLAKKKSFKLSFNTFKPGRNFYDVEKINLNGEHNDPSILREKLFWDAMYKANSPALRCNYVKLFVNGNYFGLYINIEDLDEIFTQSRFGNNDGNLYKCYYGADLNYKGVNGNLYKFSGSFCGKTQRVYELQNNIPSDNYQQLADFISALNNLPADTFFASKIKQYFNVEGYLKILALEVASGHWDNYVWNSNNYFLYENAYTKQFEYLSYDADNTFGIGWSADDWGTKDVHQFNSGKNRPLYSKILSVPEFKNKFDYYLQEITSTIYDTAFIFPRIDFIHNQIWTAAVADTFRTLDYGFTVGQFHNSFVQTIGVTHVKYGLKPFFTARNKSIEQQILNNNIIPVLIREKHIPEFASTSNILKFAITSYDDETPLTVKIHFSYDLNSGFIAATLFDDGLHDDGAASDGIWGIQLPAHPMVDTLLFYYSASSASNQVTRYPSIGNLILPIGVKSNLKLRINELMAKNTSIIMDELNEYDDWLEIYNEGNFGITLNSVYLSNSMTMPTKFQLPNEIILPKSFKLFWCDNQTIQGAYHTNFKLSANNEWIGLFENNGLLIDSVRYTSLGNDVSLGRTSDGIGPFALLNNRTPGYSNNGFSYGIISPEEAKTYTVYPNPAKKAIRIQASFNTTKENFRIYNLLGTQIMEGEITEKETIVPLFLIPEGVYILQCGATFFTKIGIVK